ncbi:unnamed protein product [Urochloa humidicola]
MRRYECLKPCASSILTTFAVALMWLQVVVATARIGLPNCPTICGNLSVPYPFGIAPRCHLGQRFFNLTCSETYPLPQLFLTDLQGKIGQVVSISLDDSTVALGGFQPYTGTKMPPGLHLFSGLLLQWELVSSALQGPNKMRAGNATCPRDLNSTTCHSSHSTCQATTRRDINGYVCRCDDGYQGNSYLEDGCQDINECDFPDKYKCFGNCTNLPGKYLFQCPEGNIGDPYTPNGCTKPHDPKTGYSYYAF